MQHQEATSLLQSSATDLSKQHKELETARMNLGLLRRQVRATEACGGRCAHLRHVSAGQGRWPIKGREGMP